MKKTYNSEVTYIIQDSQGRVVRGVFTYGYEACKEFITQHNLTIAPKHGIYRFCDGIDRGLFSVLPDNESDKYGGYKS